MVPTAQLKHDTAEYGTNSEQCTWYSKVWHQQCRVQMAQQFMAPRVHNIDGKAVYGTNSANTDDTGFYGTNIAQYFGVTIRTAVFSCLYQLGGK
jgi:hypothetical protein